MFANTIILYVFRYLNGMHSKYVEKLLRNMCASAPGSLHIFVCKTGIAAD